ncbi:Cro/CI family transcriptional regulator [Celerinatantimonas diazotrophica]|uniref:Cro/CI family transcriptional regulator n=1 Tax=Celerinatantimonas diazotrophica TaxID=412034 RepID=UPI00104D409B|nr:Cro/CI family transcriptional regulator [Celerinatantimonas diazotrophica]
MEKVRVLRYFGYVTQTALALDITHPAVSRWNEIIPEKQALRIAMLTHGALEYDPALYHCNQHRPKTPPAPRQSK